MTDLQGQHCLENLLEMQVPGPRPAEEKLGSAAQQSSLSNALQVILILRKLETAAIIKIRRHVPNFVDRVVFFSCSLGPCLDGSGLCVEEVFPLQQNKKKRKKQAFGVKGLQETPQILLMKKGPKI